MRRATACAPRRRSPTSRTHWAAIPTRPIRASLVGRKSRGLFRPSAAPGTLHQENSGPCIGNLLKRKRKEIVMSNTKTRTEHDLLGDLPVPADAYYGVQTARALEN